MSHERYQEHFFNDFHGHAHCTSTCDICIEHASIHFSCVNYELSRFKANYFNLKADDSKFHPFTHTYEQDDQLFKTFTSAVLYHKYTKSCMLPIIKKPHFYSFSYQSMLIYAYYTNLTPPDKGLFEKCHTYHNDLFNDILEILKEKLELIWGWLPFLTPLFANLRWSKPIYYWSALISISILNHIQVWLTINFSFHKTSVSQTSPDFPIHF